MQDEVRDLGFFDGLDPAALALTAGCATNLPVRADTYLFHEGEPADRLFVVRHGRIALEIHRPGGGIHVLDTLDDGEVIGWSWLVPPYRWFLDARAVEDTSLVAFDGVCLRGKCEDDPALGYALMQRVAYVMYRRLQSARVRLLDLYGS